MPRPIRGAARYHARYRSYAGSGPHRRYLQRAYAFSLERARAMGRDPLRKERPRVLLCGTGSAATTEEFVRFVRAQRAAAEIHVLDLNPAPLLASARALGDSVCFVRADGRLAPYPGGAFDLIETDFLLQFLSPEAKAELAREWARLLDPQDGVALTRDWVRDSAAKVRPQTALDLTRRAIVSGLLGASTYSTTAAELRGCFAAAGLAVEILPSTGNGGPRIPLMKFITAAPTR